DRSRTPSVLGRRARPGPARDDASDGRGVTVDLTVRSSSSTHPNETGDDHEDDGDRGGDGGSGRSAAARYVRGGGAARQVRIQQAEVRREVLPLPARRQHEDAEA